VAVVASACAQEETADPHIHGRSRRDGKLGEKVDPRGFIASNDSLEDSRRRSRAERMIGNDLPLRDFLQAYPLSLLRFGLSSKLIGTYRARRRYPK